MDAESTDEQLMVAGRRGTGQGKVGLKGQLSSDLSHILSQDVCDRSDYNYDAELGADHLNIQSGQQTHLTH